MEQKRLEDLLEQKVVLLDGATGSYLQKNGLPSGVCVEQWICEHREVLVHLQKAYVEAGSEIVYAPTFGANRLKLKEFGLEENVSDLNRQLVAISRQAVGGKTRIAGDVSMTGQQLAPLGTLDFDELVEVYKEQMLALEQGGADLIVVETMMNLQEMRAALIAAKESVALPVAATMSFGGDGRTLYGTDAKTAAVVMKSLGAVAVGVNCSAGPDQMTGIVRSMREAVNGPVIAKPNAGMPILKEGITEYSMHAEEFANCMKELVGAGASVIGGCCGTNPDFIQNIKKLSENRTPVLKTEQNRVILTSERMSIEWNEQTVTAKISTREHPELIGEWNGEDFDSIFDWIDEAEDMGAEAVCICVDGTEQPVKAIRAVVEQVVSAASKPLIFDVEEDEVLEAALRYYPGRAGILKTETVSEKRRQLAEHYGGIFV